MFISKLYLQFLNLRYSSIYYSGVQQKDQRPGLTHMYKLNKALLL